jgi:hypothetical protein
MRDGEGEKEEEERVEESRSDDLVASGADTATVKVAMTGEARRCEGKAS